MDNYEQNIRLRHNEQAAKVNSETGEIKLISPVKKTRKNKFFEYLDVNTPYNKNFKAGWIYLVDVLTARQIKIAMVMSHIAKPTTNSLIPLNDDCTVRELAEVFSINKNTVKEDMKALFKYGVYARFEVEQKDSPHTKFWIFNPYLSSNGTYVHRHSKNLFSNTTIATLVRARG